MAMRSINQNDEEVTANQPLNSDGEFKMADVEVQILEGETFSCRKFLRFAGPGFLVSVGYIDPGNCE